METFAQRLEAMRKQNLMTQADLAEKSGVALITVTRLENQKGEGNPRPDTVKKLAKALDIDPAWLLFGDLEQVKLAA
jgi:transcriptional regulator with XRE-family HTH domain